jgi:hypothetical protein
MDGVWSHLHWARVLNVSLPKPPRNLALPEFVPSLCLAEPLPTILRIRFRALTVH